MIPIQAMDECSRYFDDIRIIATERDPRDIYLTAKHRWMTLDYPCKDVDIYCKYYKWLRGTIKEALNTKVLKIQFEDLVFNYDKTVAEIEDFLEISSKYHINPKTKFIPEKSAAGCNLKSMYVEDANEIRVIEQKLSKWLYKFNT